MSGLSVADQIWNRAAMEGGGRAPEEGDAALASLLRFHSLAMSGGVLDTVERLSADEVHAAVAGFRWFGLDEAASFLDDAVNTWQTSDNSDEISEELEGQFKTGYSAVVPDDETLVAAFEHRLSNEPTAFLQPA
jgi:hypothetical protein